MCYILFNLSEGLFIPPNYLMFVRANVGWVGTNRSLFLEFKKKIVVIPVLILAGKLAKKSRIVSRECMT